MFKVAICNIQLAMENLKMKSKRGKKVWSAQAGIWIPDLESSYFPRRPQKLTKSSPSIWHLLHNVKCTAKIFVKFVAFLKNINLNKNVFSTCIILVNPQNISCLILGYLMEEGDPLIKIDLYKKTAWSRERWAEGPSGQIVTGEIIVMSCCNTSKVIIY